MAKAVFHKHQRVFVEPVGTWAVIEHVKPHWVRGVDEPLKVFYDVGLGRDFAANELVADDRARAKADYDKANWRVVRAHNRNQAAEECPHHPVPGTYPVVVTDDVDWGGWRVPGQEYDRDPAKVEFQARAMASSLRLLRLAQEVVAFADQDTGDTPEAVIAAAREAREVLRYVASDPSAPEESAHNTPGDAEGANAPATFGKRQGLRVSDRSA